MIVSWLAAVRRREARKQLPAKPKAAKVTAPNRIESDSESAESRLTRLKRSIRESLERAK